MLLQRAVLPMQVPRLAHRKEKLVLLMQALKPELQKERLDL